MNLNSEINAALIEGGGLGGAAAARCTFWPDTPMTIIKVAAGRRNIAPQPRYQFTQRLIPADLIIEHRGSVSPPQH